MEDIKRICSNCKHYKESCTTTFPDDCEITEELCDNFEPKEHLTTDDVWDNGCPFSGGF